MARTSRKSGVSLTASDARNLRNAVRYIAKLKTFLKKQHQWEIRIRRDIVRLIHKCDPGGPGLPPAPPPPPFRP